MIKAQCVELVVHLAHKMDGKSLITVDTNFFYSQTFCNGEGAHYESAEGVIIWSTTTRESAKGAIVWNMPQPAQQGSYFC